MKSKLIFIYLSIIYGGIVGCSNSSNNTIVSVNDTDSVSQIMPIDSTVTIPRLDPEFCEIRLGDDYLEAVKSLEDRNIEINRYTDTNITLYDISCNGLMYAGVHYDVDDYGKINRIGASTNYSLNKREAYDEYTKIKERYHAEFNEFETSRAEEEKLISKKHERGANNIIETTIFRDDIIEVSVSFIYFKPDMEPSPNIIEGFTHDNWFTIIEYSYIDKDYSTNDDESNRNFVGEWLYYYNQHIVIYEQNGLYYADCKVEGTLSEKPYELTKTTINGHLGFKPTETDESSESFEIRENGIFVRSLDGSSGQFFKKAE